MGKAKKLIRSSLFGVSETVLTTGISLFMMPFSIFHLGDRMYGLWLLIGSFSGFYGLLDLGLMSAVQRYWSRALGLKDYEEANKVFNSSLVFFSILGLLVFIISIGVSSLAPVFFKDVTEINLFRKIIVIVGFGLAFSFPMRTFWALYAVHLRTDLHSRISMAQLIVRTILIVLFLTKGYKLLAFATIIIATDLGAFLALSLLSFKTAPYIRIKRKHMQISQIKKMLGFSVFSFIGKIAGNISAASDNFVITGFLGLQAIPMYAVARRLLNYFGQFMHRIIGSVMPVFSELEAQNSFDEIRDRFWFFTKISGYCAALIAGSLIIFGKSFIICWMGSQYSFAYNILLVLIIFSIINLSQIPSGQLLLGISKHKFMAFVNLGIALLNLLISILLVPKYGLMGVALGTCIAGCIGKFIIMPIYVCRQLNASVGKYFLHYFKIFIVSSVFFIAEYRLIHSYIQPNYFSLVFWAAISSLLFCVIAFFVGFNRNERDYLVRVILKK